MNHFQKGIEMVKNGMRVSDEQKYTEAIECYSQALKHFVGGLMGDEILPPSFKNEVNEQIMFCFDRLDTLNKYNLCKDDEQIMERIKSTIMCKKSTVRFSDVCGMEKEKKLLEAAVILPVHFPDTFTRRRSSFKAFLFYGPPGTGKSFIAEALAGEVCKSTFFSVSASDLTSKYQGESENLVKNLFKVARLRKPSIVFIDEIDSLMLSRSDSDSDGARRIKTELLIQMQGVSSDNSGVFMMAATNFPYNLDIAFLRRFDKLVYVPLPDKGARIELFKSLLLNNEHDDNPKDIKEEDFEVLGKITKGLSGSDIFTICKLAKMRTVTRMQNSSHFCKVYDEGRQKWFYTPCSSSDKNAIEMEIRQVPYGSDLNIPIVTVDDVMTQAKIAKPRCKPDQVATLKKFAQEMGDNYRSDEEIHEESCFDVISRCFTGCI